MARGKTSIFTGLALIFVLIAVLPETSCDRSPYVPDPVTYPGLLPQFTSTTLAPPGSAGGQQRPTPTRRPQGEDKPKPSTTTTEAAAGEETDLGDRFGEERPENRPDGSGGPQRPQTQRPQTQRPQTQRPPAQGPCEGQAPRVPCYDCIVYISRTGQITRFYPRDAGGL